MLLVRTDSDSRIGSGHAMRCLALAQAWQDSGGRAAFIMASATRPFSSRLKAEGIDLYTIDATAGGNQDARRTVESVARHKATWVVVDGYHFDGSYQKTLKDSGTGLLFIDDYGHAGHYPADIVLNQNIYAIPELYLKKEPYTRLLLGTKYALLRREFLRWSTHPRKIPETAARIMVTMGGSDPENATLKVIRVLQRLDIKGLEAVVVLGGINRHSREIAGQLGDSNIPIRLENNVTGMAELICRADLAVSAGGSTCWELAFLGLPNIILVLAENQRKIAEGLEQTGISVNLGPFEDCSEDKLEKAIVELIHTKQRRERMSRRGRRLVDGLGAVRVVRELHSSRGC